MVNGFFGVALVHHKSLEQSDVILENINRANAVGEFSFYENFNTQTKEPNGVPYCAWSAAGAILLHQVRHNNFKILI